MKLRFTRKTWYFLLLASAAASMLNGFAVLSGNSFGLIEQIAFAMAGISALFLAAEKGSAGWEKRNFTGVFVLLMVSYMINGWAGYLCSALAWPLLLSTEYKRGDGCPAPAPAGGCGGGPPPALPADGKIRRHGRAGLLDESALGAAGLRPGLGSTEPLQDAGGRMTQRRRKRRSRFRAAGLSGGGQAVPRWPAQG